MAVFVASSVAAGARKPVKLAEHERNRATRKHRQVIGIARKIALPGIRTPVRRADDGLDRHGEKSAAIQWLTFRSQVNVTIPLYSTAILAPEMPRLTGRTRTCFR